jgi:hypothetical protein
MTRGVGYISEKVKARSKKERERESLSTRSKGVQGETFAHVAGSAALTSCLDETAIIVASVVIVS